MSCKLLFLISLYILCGTAFSFPQIVKEFYELEDAEYLFQQFIRKHGKDYANEEERQIRFYIFKNNLIDINELNARSKNVVFGITKFADLTIDEFSSFLGRRSPEQYFETCTTVTDNDVNTNDAPDAFDWRDKNVVGQVQDQQTCGACWAFGAIGNIEGQYAIKNGEVVQFSEQQLVDCDQRSVGCSGGFASNAFHSLIEMGGIMTEQDYPYKDSNGTCAFDVSKVKAKLTDCRSYDLKDEDKIKELLFKTGPLAIAINGAPLQKYHGGVMDVVFCPISPPSHVVLLVGYGTENGEPFWIIKNSWGTGFGENGYFRMKRGTNTCGFVNISMASSILA